MNGQQNVEFDILYKRLPGGTGENHKETKWILHTGRYSTGGGEVSTASPSESNVSVFLIVSLLLLTCYHNPVGKKRILL
jgi:hypothetical protein